MEDCIFCKIIKKEIPASVEMETETVVAFKSIAPAATVHVLIVPKKHIESFTHLQPEDKDTFYDMIQVSQMLVKDKKISEGYKLTFNGGKYQSVPHLHWHLLGGEFDKKWKDKL